MYIITATFDSDAAMGRTSELLALGDSPERLAERLGLTRDLEVVKQGVLPTSFKRVAADIVKIKQYMAIEKQMEEVKSDKSMLRFLGDGFKAKQLLKYEEALRKFGALLEAPQWLYKQPRVQLLSAIRDYGLDGSQQGDAAWTEVEDNQLVFPIAQMYEDADEAFAATLIAQLEKPLKDIDPRFLLEKFEGNRSISFDFATSIVQYYTPAPAH